MVPDYDTSARFKWGVATTTTTYDDGTAVTGHCWYKVVPIRQIVQDVKEFFKKELRLQAKQALSSLLNKLRIRDIIKLPEIYPLIPKWDYRYCSNISGRRDPKCQLAE
jgi:hypothetical protein